MSDANDLIDQARDGEKAPFVALFAEPDGVAKFMALRDEFTQATPVHMVAANAHIDLLKFIMESLPDAATKQAAANAANDSGNTPLHWAALTGSLEVAKILVEAGSDPLKKNLAGIDPCFQADSAGQNDVANYLYSVASLDEFDDDDEEETKKDENK